MKKNKKDPKEKKFLALPKYPGGNNAFRKFIEDNLKYPEEAIKNKIEGIVYVSCTVNDNGDVIEAIITKGIGYKCNEEALRLVKMLKYEKVRNRGLRVYVKIKTRITFKIKNKPTKIQYHYSIKNDKKTDKISKKKDSSSVTYGYQLKYRNNID